MEQPKDYYECYKARFSKKDMDDTWLDGLGIGIGSCALLFVIILTAVMYYPIF